ncbi:FHA domain-containing protein [Arsukibacterium sp.]|uniref:FHA domain-containing protein n=1 Tax=Arsukibacterium sp. TaxID=1977258 RepID=UPI002FDA7C19
MQGVIIRVGRCSQSNDVVLEDASVSRQHLRLTVTNLQNVQLEDCQSSFGSFYWDGNQWLRFHQAQLTANDYIYIGATKLRLMEVIIAYQINRRRRSA